MTTETKITKKQIEEVKKTNSSPLVKKVVSMILDGRNAEECQNYMKDTLNHGCQSGTVSELIYYSDTIAFYKKYQTQINELLKETMEQFDYNSPEQIFGSKWDNSDPLAMDMQNQNLLAWFAFEETTRNIMSECGIDY